MAKKLPKHIEEAVKSLIIEMINYIDIHGMDFKCVSYKVNNQSQSVLLFREKAYNMYLEHKENETWSVEDRVEFLHSFGRKTTKLMFKKIDYVDYRAKYIK